MGDRDFMSKYVKIVKVNVIETLPCYLGESCIKSAPISFQPAFIMRSVYDPKLISQPIGEFQPIKILFNQLDRYMKPKIVLYYR